MAASAVAAPFQIPRNAIAGTGSAAAIITSIHDDYQYSMMSASHGAGTVSPFFYTGKRRVRADARPWTLFVLLCRSLGSLLVCVPMGWDAADRYFIRVPPILQTASMSTSS